MNKLIFNILIYYLPISQEFPMKEAKCIYIITIISKLPKHWCNTTFLSKSLAPHPRNSHNHSQTPNSRYSGTQHSLIDFQRMRDVCLVCLCGLS